MLITATSVVVFRTSDGGATYGETQKLMGAPSDWFGRSNSVYGNVIAIARSGMHVFSIFGLLCGFSVYFFQFYAFSFYQTLNVCFDCNIY